MMIPLKDFELVKTKLSDLDSTFRIEKVLKEDDEKGQQTTSHLHRCYE